MNQKQELNFKILEILQDYLTQNPDIRFGQALHNLNIATHRLLDDKENRPYNNIDIFYEEPEQTLLKMRNFNQEHIQRAKNQNITIEHLTLEELLEKFGDVLTEQEISKLKEYGVSKNIRVD